MTIGLSQTVYSVVEEEGVAVVCTSVLSGTTSGRMFSISYQTTDGDARGINHSIIFLVLNILFPTI